VKAGHLDPIDHSGIKQICRRFPDFAGELKLTAVGDQSIFVPAPFGRRWRKARSAGPLTGVMILLFLGSWRSTLIITVSIPLAHPGFGDHALPAR